MMETIKKEFSKEQLDYVKQAFSDHLSHIIRFEEDEQYRETSGSELSPKAEAEAFCYEVGLSCKDFRNLFELINQERTDLIQGWC